MTTKRDRMCRDKRRHLTRDAAMITAKRVVKTGMNVYQCPFCQGWHLGRSSAPASASDRIGALLRRHARRLDEMNGRK